MNYEELSNALAVRSLVIIKGESPCAEKIMEGLQFRVIDQDLYGATQNNNNLRRQKLVILHNKRSIMYCNGLDYHTYAINNSMIRL